VFGLIILLSTEYQWLIKHAILFYEISGLGAPEPAGDGWMVFTVEKTLSIPSLQIDALVIYVEYTYFEDELDDGPFGAFRMHGVGTITDENGDPIGVNSFSNLGMYDATGIGEGVLDLVTDGTEAGTFSAGPFIGIATIEKATIDAQINLDTGQANWYDSFHVGFLLVPDSVDMKELRASLRE
jgi:hypothetical protein